MGRKYRKRFPSDKVHAMARDLPTHDRYYLRFTGCESEEALKELKALVGKRIGRVCASGLGTASDPRSAWFEVAPKKSVWTEVVTTLKKYGLGDKIMDAFPIQRGEGKVQARQLPLLPLG